ncbi:type VI secretion system protein TssA [Ramlibacter sp.]|uniref:type VI secretion system protein TssA n=1 Tax=Ramlibacter sp. TaxID=1917967 RepID=UPI003D0964B3
MNAMLSPVPETLLQALSPDEPCGPSMRYDPLFTEVRLAREEDDPSLPMGQWQRPLKKADWGMIEQRCTTFLTHKSKDLQIAAWLLEAWTRQKGWAGFSKGLGLLRELATQYWDGLHPRIDEDGDADARVAPFQWLNESLPLTLKVHVTLISLPGNKPSKVTLADWERMTHEELTGGVSPRPGADPDEEPLTRAQVQFLAAGDPSGAHAAHLAQVRECIVHLAALDRLLDDKLGTDAPNLHKVLGTLEAAERVLLQLVPAPEPEVQAEPLASSEHTGEAGPSPEGSSVPSPIPFIPRAPMQPIRLDGVTNREEAYRALEALAEYLGTIEPHSPTPYLIRRAVNWGRMPLPELMQEILREEGDLNRMTQLLGLNRD